jgi:cytochrome d ubiquinol oxidase subunit I
MTASGSWRPGDGFFAAFFNPSFVPQVLLRTGASLALGALGLGLILAFQRADAGDRDRQMRRMALWALSGLGLIVVGAGGYFATLPEHARMNLLRAPALNIMTALTAGACALLGLAFAASFFTGARWLSPPYAVLLVLVGATAVAGGEFMREGARKPYRIDKLIYGPGVRVGDVPAIQARGLVASAPWLKAALAAPPVETKGGRHPGAAVFRYHCSACHARVGYNGILPIVRPWTPEMLEETIRNLHRAHPAMPPWLGNDDERKALVAYLSQYTEGSR